MSLSENIDAGIWIRVSTDDQAKGDSPEHHRVRARGYADAKGWQVKEVYDLSGVSGKSVLEHPEAKWMMADIERGHISALIFSKIARLARNTKELLEIADFFQAQSAGLITLQESIDTTSPAGRLFYTMIAAMAQWEREEISDRVSASVVVRAKLGKPTGGAAPFGYKWVGKTLEIDPEEAPVRKLIFDLFMEHKRKRTVARKLNEMGYRTRRGGKFRDNAIERYLRDPITKGMRRANYTKSRGDGQAWDLKPEDEWVYTEITPIVSEEVWNEVNHFLDDQLATSRKTARKPAKKNLFVGIATCACGGKMYCPSSMPKYVCKDCKRKILKEDLETIFEHQLSEFLLSEDEINAYLSQTDQTMTDEREQLEILKKELSHVDKEMKKVYDLYIAEEITRERFAALHRPLETRCGALNQEIPKKQSEIDFLTIDSISSQHVLHETKSLHARWQTLSLEDKRQLIETITESIIIDETSVEIRLHYLPLLEQHNMAPHPQRLHRLFRQYK